MKDQPKPATGEPYAERRQNVWPYSDKPTGEWTADDLYDLGMEEATEKAKTINAALAAAFKAGASKLKFEAEDELNQIGDLQQQLAAEREKRMRWHQDDERTIKQLREQLAAEREKVKGLHEACRAEANHSRQLREQLADEREKNAKV